MAVAVTMAGGYAENLEDVVDIHFQSIVQAATYVATGSFISFPTAGKEDSGHAQA